jgi:hypothetical protein
VRSLLIGGSRRNVQPSELHVGIKE